MESFWERQSSGRFAPQSSRCSAPQTDKPQGEGGDESMTC